MALLIVAPQPESVEQQIAEMTAVAGFHLSKRPTVVLRDIYWDLPSRLLGVRKLALRLRVCDEQTWITLKGPSEIVGEVGVRRMELEEAWSVPALRKLLDTLEEEGVLVSRSVLEEPDGEPMEIMRALGLEVIQDRETRREPRDVLPVEPQDAEPVAELAVDATRYHVAGRSVTLRQIEIEAKKPGGESAIEAIAAEIYERCPQALQRWKFSKLATGLALVALAARDELDRLFLEDGGLAPATYGLIANYLRCEIA